MDNQRRSFIQRSGLTAMSMSTLPLIRSNNNRMDTALPDNMTVLFQGDSITDAHRARDHYYANDLHGMGLGYVYQTIARLSAEKYKTDFSFYNRGISGNKVYQLADRWEDDALNLNPDVISILIGVNDFWHMIGGHYDAKVDVYKRDYKALIERTLDALPKVKLIICEPFVVWGGSAINTRWKEEFPVYQDAAKELATEFGTAFVPFQRTFDEALRKAPATLWCPDGVHPSHAGAKLMADTWLEVFYNLKFH